jgi:hypothetical protein
MTEMPEMVAVLHSFVGLAAVLVGISTYLAPPEVLTGASGVLHAVEVYLDVTVGAVTFAGSIVAWAKLNGRASGKPLLLPGRHRLNAIAAGVLLLLAVPTALSTGGTFALLLATVNVAGSVGVGYPFQELTPVVQQFADDAEPLASAPIAIDLAGDEYVAGAVQSGLIVELEARGFQPRGRPDQRLQIGSHRTDVPLEPSYLLVSVEAQSGAPGGGATIPSPVAPVVMMADGPPAGGCGCHGSGVPISIAANGPCGTDRSATAIAYSAMSQL